MKTKYLIIGSGRMANHFGYYLTQLKVPFLSWSRNNNPHFNTLSNINGPQDRLEKSAIEATHILVLIKDSEIENFLVNNKTLFDGKTITHFSGATIVKSVQSCHPLMTFSSELYPFSEYLKIPFIIEKGPLSKEALLPKLPNPFEYIDSDKKPLYHAYCVSAGNFTSLLWQNTFVKSFNNLGLTQNLFIPFLHKVIHNLAENPSSALTGPLQRNDNLTIQSNLRALEGSALQGVYKAFIELNKEIHENINYLPENRGPKRIDHENT